MGPLPPLIRTHTHTHNHTHTHTRTHTYTHTLSISHTHSHSLSPIPLPLSPPSPISLSLSLPLSTCIRLSTYLSLYLCTVYPSLSTIVRPALFVLFPNFFMVNTGCHSTVYIPCVQLVSMSPEFTENIKKW